MGQKSHTQTLAPRKATSKRLSPGRWIRLYTSALHDPKIVSLSDRMHRAWINLLTIADKADGFLPSLKHIACDLRCTLDQAKEIIDELVEAELIDRLEIENPPISSLYMHNWGRRQYRWDDVDRTSSERVRRHRAKKRAIGTPPSEATAEPIPEVAFEGDGDQVADTTPHNQQRSERRNEQRSKPSVKRQWNADETRVTVSASKSESVSNSVLLCTKLSSTIVTDSTVQVGLYGDVV